MTTLRESYLYHLWTVLCAVYYDSGVHRCLAALGAWALQQAFLPLVATEDALCVLPLPVLLCFVPGTSLLVMLCGLGACVQLRRLRPSALLRGKD